jgi:hypothetical protein
MQHTTHTGETIMAKPDLYTDAYGNAAPGPRRHSGQQDQAMKKRHAATGRTAQDIDYTYFTGRTVCDPPTGMRRTAGRSQAQSAWSDSVTCEACLAVLANSLANAWPPQ